MKRAGKCSLSTGFTLFISLLMISPNAVSTSTDSPAALQYAELVGASHLLLPVTVV